MDTVSLWLPALLMLVVVLALVWYVRKVQHGQLGRAGSAIIVRERCALEARRALYIVEVAGKQLLVGTSEQGLTLLTELDAAQLPPVVAPSSFAAMVTARLRGQA